MTKIAKALVGTAAVAALAASSATPALARGGIDAGDVIAGAVVLGGIAAIASAASNNDGYGYTQGRSWDDRYDRYDRDGYDGRSYGYRQGNPRQAVQQCVYAAQREASRYSYGRADVTDIRDVDRTSRGYVVRGRIAVNSMGRGWRNGDSNYGRGWNNDYRGWNNSLRGYDAGRFTCRVQYDRVVDVDIDGIRGRY